MIAGKYSCPYPGLRPFREDESVYFKGREEQVLKIVKSLEGKKFLMLTGASGDGKSSLVYAGLIPYVKAGFFKARFNSWIIADFRPERSPLRNMAKSLTQHFKLKDESNVERELSFGFSSLIHLYKSSPYYLDYKSEAWLNADKTQQKELKSKASNLIILADQFEEFFTNSENYVNDTPSLQSQIVVNLLLETARIALEEDLPIYILCTMRSDFIGQCVAFNGLPEYVGMNQFFVPRLKRHEIHQIISEPVSLNGNKISNRLVETLINQLGNGFDQLPVLQYTLKQIWITANMGMEELDLIHLAKLSGLKADYLSPSDKNKFENWLQNLQEYKKSFFDRPSLGNVLHSHANTLYENACEHYNIRVPSKKDRLTRNEAKLIIKKTFQCLTKIDGSRAVRNRMKVNEVVNIINDPKIDGKVVGGLLEIFREPDSTFIRPFINAETVSQPLGPDEILDITHESLIRNWELLRKWTTEEYENWITFQDFDKQLQRWVANGKSDDYLLTLGSLVFFESWFTICNPNKYWLKKYDESNTNEEEKNNKAQKTIDNTIQFLQSSRKTIRVRRNILVAATISIILLLSGFSIWALIEREQAIKQQEFANVKTREAIGSEMNAELAGKKAIESQNIAIAAKNTALQSKEQAVASEHEAIFSKTRAETEAVHAFEQSQIAKMETEEAEAQRKISQKEKEKAERAELETRQLSLISLAQSLALKASLQDDPQLQGLLALQAYRYTNNNGGNVQDPVIYEALLSACSALKSPVTLKGFSSEVRAIAEFQNESFISAGKDGKLNKWSINSETVQNLNGINSPSSPIDFVAFNINGSILVTGHLNNDICLWSLDIKGSSSPPVRLKGQKGLLRAVAFNPDGSTIATAGKDSTLLLWNIQQTKIIKAINIMTYVKAVQFIDEDLILVAAENGVLEIISFKTGNITKLCSSASSFPLCCTFIRKKNMAVAGFSDGKIRIFDLNTASWKIREINDNTSGIELMTINNTGNILAVSCSDKTIKMYNLDNPEMKPIQLKDHNSKVRSLLFNSTSKLIVAYEDKTIRILEVSSDKLAGQLCSSIKRNMTRPEWKQLIGDDFEYEKTCINK
jgi:WD40 repeat protein/energy-coupling factor transporter ATP-binding protein EcfA2